MFERNYLWFIWKFKSPRKRRTSMAIYICQYWRMLIVFTISFCPTFSLFVPYASTPVPFGHSHGIGAFNASPTNRAPSSWARHRARKILENSRNLPRTNRLRQAHCLRHCHVVACFHYTRRRFAGSFNPDCVLLQLREVRDKEFRARNYGVANNRCCYISPLHFAYYPKVWRPEDAVCLSLPWTFNAISKSLPSKNSRKIQCY